MKRLNVTVQCMAVYNSSIDVPDDFGLEEAVQYAKEHIDEIPCGELEYVSDSDVLDEENCSFEDDKDDEDIRQDPTVPVLDARIQENALSRCGDLVFCGNCGRTMLVDIGEQVCPECGEECLQWATDNSDNHTITEKRLAQMGYILLGETAYDDVTNR